jgi:hypothetical protein
MSPLAGTISILKSSSLLGIMVLLLASCNRSKDQWILRSYDKDKGYTFMRNGVEYLAKCFAFGWTEAGKTDIKWDNTISNNPVEATHENSCDEVLPYLGKPVPKLRQDGTILYFDGNGTRFTLEFEIKSAK